MRAVIYARYSSTNQREESIEAQVRACTEHINRQKDWICTAQYVDRAFSARSDQRPEFQRMIKDAKIHKFDILVIHKLDRFSRDRYDHAYYKRELKRAGVRLVSVLENLDDSPESVMLESVLEGFSEYYSRNLGREVMKGLHETALACRHTGGVPPLGYDVGPDGKYIVNEPEAAAVRFIFESYINGDGYSKIIDGIKLMGVKGKRGGQIAKNSLHDILKNEKYTGTFVYNRSAAKDAYGKRNGHANKPADDITRIEGGMPQIITREVWHKAQSKMRTNKSGRHRAKEPYLLSGLLYCGQCGHALVGSSRGPDGLKCYYECSGKKRLRICDMQSVERDLIENKAIAHLEKLLDRKTIDDAATWASENVKIYRKSAASEIKNVRKQLESVTREANALLDKIMSGMDSDLARQRLSNAEAQKLRLELLITDMLTTAEALRCISKGQIKAYLIRLRQLKEKERQDQAQIIKDFVEKIEIFAADIDGERVIKIRTKLDCLIENPRIELAEREGFEPSVGY